MRSVWKYKLDGGRTTLVLPRSSKVLCVGLQNRTSIQVWVEQNTADDVPGITYEFYVIGTGHELPRDNAIMHYVGTVFQGALVWHIYYRKSP